MITIRAWKASEEEPVVLDVGDFDPATMMGDWELVWIDLVGDEPQIHLDYMQDRLGLPKLAIEDALRDRHPPKHEELDDDWRFLLMRGFDVGSTSVKFGTIQLALFWCGNVLVTRHVESSTSVAAMEADIARGGMTFPDGPGTLVYGILRKLLDLYLPLILQIEARLEEIEELILTRPSDRLLGELMEFSSQLKRLRRIGGYHEKAFVSMRAHTLQSGIKVSAQLTDLLEHAERLHSLSSLLYETTADLTDGYLSVSAHRLNNVMRVLTVVTVLFVPLTFIAGIYGMNFAYIPELAWRWGYFAVLGVMAMLVAGLLVLFRRRHWI